MLVHIHIYPQLDVHVDEFKALTTTDQCKRTLMMDLENEAINVQEDTGTPLRQRRPQGSIVATCTPYMYSIQSFKVQYYLLHDFLTFEWKM